MKKKLIRIVAALFLLSVLILPSSCDTLSDCGTCKLITDNDGKITEAPGLIFCGEKLLDKQNSTPVTVGKITTYWECEDLK